MIQQKNWILIIIMGLLITACSSREDARAQPELSEVEELQEQAEPSLPEQPEAAQPALVCEDPPPTELGLGGTFDGSIDDPFWVHCFWVEIPEGLGSVTFELGGLSADLDLFVGYGFLVTMQYHTGEFWRVGESGAADETLILENPKPGPYYLKVGIAGPKDPSPFTIAVRTDPETISPPTGQALPDPEICGSPALEVSLDSVVDGEVLARDERPLSHQYFCAQVPDGLNNLTIKLTGLEGNLDLFVRNSNHTEWYDRTRGGSERIVIIDHPASGAYSITVFGAHPGAGSAFALSVTGE